MEFLKKRVVLPTRRLWTAPIAEPRLNRLTIYEGRSWMSLNLSFVTNRDGREARLFRGSMPQPSSMLWREVSWN